MKKWTMPLLIVLFFVCLAILFVIPAFSYQCTEKLFECMNFAVDLGFWARLWAHLVCVFRNVVCVLGGVVV